jgi:DNA-binding NarL/FixJ family response regulator
MKNQLTILLIDSSAITSVRFLELLRDTEEVDKVFYAKDIIKGFKTFLVSTIDILILTIQLPQEELSQLVNICTLYRCKIIFLSDYTHLSYMKWCSNLGIAYVLDKVSEGNKMIEIIKQIKCA